MKDFLLIASLITPVIVSLNLFVFMKMGFGGGMVISLLVMLLLVVWFLRPIYLSLRLSLLALTLDFFTPLLVVFFHPGYRDVDGGLLKTLSVILCLTIFIHEASVKMREAVGGKD